MLQENPYRSPVPGVPEDRRTVRPTKREYALAAAAVLWIGYLVLSLWLDIVGW